MKSSKLFSFTGNAGWTKGDFDTCVGAIVAENQGRKNLDEYALYGAFHEWKANNTNFHDAATKILGDDSDYSEEEQALLYSKVIYDVCSAWSSFCFENEVDPVVSVKLAQKYTERELSKVSHWLKKSSKSA